MSQHQRDKAQDDEDNNDRQSSRSLATCGIGTRVWYKDKMNEPLLAGPQGAGAPPQDVKEEAPREPQ